MIDFCVALFLINGDPERRTRGALYLAAFHVLLLMFLWAFWATVLTDPGLPSSIPNLVVLNKHTKLTNSCLVINTNPSGRRSSSSGKGWKDLATKFSCTLLHDMPIRETRPIPSLLRLQTMCPQNGPSLHVAQQLCRPLQLQIVHSYLIICCASGSVHEHFSVPAVGV